MKKTVFYSWESDLPAALNRNFIEDCIKRALRAIGRDESVFIEPAIDRDTANRPGSPDIASTIIAKISMSEVFVADISIINKGASRPTPNPNVLLELGYAVAKLGWDYIILVQNEAFGGPELLPFDLRGRRTVCYHASEKADRVGARGLLQPRLETGLRTALEVNLFGIARGGESVNLWWGKWSHDIAHAIVRKLFIREVGSGGFLFDLVVYRGHHTGTVTAYARIASPDFAYCRLPDAGLGGHPELLFRRRMENGYRTIEIEEFGGPNPYHGAGVSFNGSYIREREPWFEFGFVNEIELARLYALLGEHLERMRSCTVAITNMDCLDNDLRARAMSGGVPGLFTSMESILMINGAGEIWAAYLQDNIVHYFTNVLAHREILPKTIVEWTKHFSGAHIVYCEPVEVVPTRNFIV